MLNTEHFTLLAGNPQKWDNEIVRRKGESLTDIQKDQYRRGRRSASLHSVHQGTQWIIVAASFDWPELMCPAQDNRDDAIEAGKAWVNEDPENREFFVRNKLLETQPPE
jgi:hypothetical protein